MKFVVDKIPLEEVYKKLSSGESFYVSTVVKVISIVKEYACGDKWTLSSLDVGPVNEGSNIKIRLNLWDRFSLLAGDLEQGDILFITNALAKNYEYAGKIYPQLNCSERQNSNVEVKYQRERILVDGSNVARSVEGKSIECLELMRTKLLSMGYAPVIIVDANLRHLLTGDKREKLESMLKNNVIFQSPAGVKADEALLKISDEKGFRIVSNDQFKEYMNTYPWIDRRRISFTIIGSDVLLYDL